ncbi:MAG: hypothetical protein C4525_15320 [Desulfarculus sp.]|jgi:hypothetical protein|nr:MAG: hypothetical protein C4525_15320 [Desulfarculus sp.]
MDWLNNSWLIGIIGGLISGVLVTIISGFCLARRENRRYFRKVSAANKEVILSIKPGISENFIPNLDVFEALINATSRGYEVDPADLHSPSEIAEELTKEIMGSSFIPARAKEEYCKQLEGLRMLTEGGASKRRGLAESELEGHKKSEMDRYRTRMVRMLSVMLGGFAWLISTAVFYMNYFRYYLANLPDFTFKVIFMIALIILAAIISCLVTLIFRWLESERAFKPKTDTFFISK